MDEKGLRVLVEAAAVKRAHIVANGDSFHVLIDSAGRSFSIEITKGGLRTWRTIDATAKWLRSVGIAQSMLDTSKWHPGQRGLPMAVI
jgi:23S rRNA G2445 N2-methylase RlmL